MGIMLMCLSWSMALAYAGLGILGLLALVGLIGGLVGLRQVLKNKSIGLVPKQEKKEKVSLKPKTNKSANNCNKTIVVLMVGLIILLSIVVGGVVYVALGM